MGFLSNMRNAITGKVEPGKTIQAANVGLWDSAVSQVIAESFRLAKQQITAAEADQTQQLVDALNYVFSDHFADYWAKIHPERAKEFAQVGNVEHQYMPLIRMMASRLSVAFHTTPETYLYRTVDGEQERLPESDPQVQQWRRDWRSAKLATILPALDLMLPALRNVLVFMQWVRGAIRWRLYIPRLDCWIDQDPDLPEEIEHATQVTIEIRKRKDSSDTLYVNRHFMSWRYDENFEQPWTLFFHDEHGRELTNADGTPYRPLFDGAQNEYGLHPFVLWRTDEPEGGHVLLPPREDWIQSQLGVNEMLTDALYGLRHQTHAQPVIERMLLADGAAPVIGPKRALLFPDGGDFRYVGPPVKLDELRETLNAILRIRSVTEDMPPDTFEASGSTRNFNAKKLEAFALILRQRRTRPALQLHWEATTEVHKRVGNYWADQGADRVRYDDDVKIGVLLPDLPWPQDEFQAEQTAQMRAQRGVTSEVDEIMKNDAVDRATAERLYAERQAARQDQAEAQPEQRAGRTPPNVQND